MKFDDIFYEFYFNFYFDKILFYFNVFEIKVFCFLK